MTVRRQRSVALAVAAAGLATLAAMSGCRSDGVTPPGASPLPTTSDAAEQSADDASYALDGPQADRDASYGAVDGPATDDAGEGGAAPPLAEVDTRPATSLGLTAFSANGRVQPHGHPTDYYFEYGTTSAYGARTATRAVPPQLSAHYHEAWNTGKGGFRGGSGTALSFVSTGGVDGGFVRYREPTGDDYNHIDGIGPIHLVQYFYPGTFDLDAPTSALGGSDPDMRDARVRVAVRGNNWKPVGTDLLFWAQAEVHSAGPGDVHYSNWAHTGFDMTDFLFSGAWENVEYRLYNDTTDWTYAGTNRELNAQLNRNLYVYNTLDDVLGHLDIDLFHLLAYVDVYKYPSGSIDFDELDIAYRNHSLLAPSNGGHLASAPQGSEEGAEALTDGWRNGAGHMWATSPSPVGPQEIVYDLAHPVTIDKVQVHQNPDWPSKKVEVLASTDGTSWTTIASGNVPKTASAGVNFTYLLAKGLEAPATKIKVRILSGYQSERWGLGEIEIFGAGATKATDDDWYRLNADVTDLLPGTTYHYRLVAVTDGHTTAGQDLTFHVPVDTTPEVATGRASRIAATSAKVEGRLNTLGGEAQVYFEYGTDATYGLRSEPKRAGPEITPRTVVATLAGLTPGTTVYYRLVAEGATTTVYGEPATFTH